MISISCVVGCALQTCMGRLVSWRDLEKLLKNVQFVFSDKTKEGAKFHCQKFFLLLK